MKTAILLSTGFTELHLTNLQKLMVQKKQKFDLLSPQTGLVQAWHNDHWGNYYPIATSLQKSLAADYEFLIIPGGERHISQLKEDAHAKRFIKYMLLARKKIALIEESQLLEEALTQDLEIDHAKITKIDIYEDDKILSFLFDADQETAQDKIAA